MGQLLAMPITAKSSTDGKTNRLSYGISSMQGWRAGMEDDSTMIGDYKGTGFSFFSVYDGHGGSSVAHYASKNLYQLVFESEAFKNGAYEESLKQSFLKIDSNLLADVKYAGESSGSTAIVLLITTDNTLYISNAGDSRAIISTNGIAEALSCDHKPTDKIELDRIKKAGCHVECGRVNGMLALSRALGDFEYKNCRELPPEEQAVTANPDITKRKINSHDEFIVLACDGIWDCMTNQQVVNFIRKEIANYIPLKEICEHIMDHCLSDVGDTTKVGCDNMTILIVALLQGREEKKWYEYIASQHLDDTPINLCIRSESREYSLSELSHAPDITKDLLDD